MLPEERRLHMVERSEETSSVHGSGEPVATKLRRIAEKACKEPGFKFTSLYHLMNEELLRGCFIRLRKDAAAGIDKMTKDMYAGNLDANLSNLIDRLHRRGKRNCLNWEKFWEMLKRFPSLQRGISCMHKARPYIRFIKSK